MQHKSTNYVPSTQALAAGLALNDNNIEIVGCKDTQTCIWLRNGSAHAFKHLPGNIYAKLKAAFYSDAEAVKAFTIYYPNVFDETRLVELYTYFVYGDLDTTPDIVDGELQPSENFRDKEDCISLAFNSKNIDFNGIPLKSRQIKMIDAWSKGIPDKTIAADILKIAITTYDFHKSKLFKLLQVESKPEAVSVAYKHHILCA